MTVPHCHPPDEGEDFRVVESNHNIEGKGTNLRIPVEMKEYLIVYGYKKTVSEFFFIFFS